MITTSERAAGKLREQLINKCLEAGIGSRTDISTVESGELTFSIGLDRQRQRDKVVESDGMKIFLGPTSARQIEGCQLDYQDEPGGGFFLNTMQEVKGE